MAGVTISYKGSSIATMQGASSNKTLKTGGKYCVGDITVDYVPEGSTPTGTINIISNGTYNVADKASAVVAVPTPTINGKSFAVTVSEDKTGKTLLTSADSDIAAHRSDSSFYVGFAAQFPYSSGLTIRNGVNTNQNQIENTTSPVYGFYFRVNSSGSNSFGYTTKAATASGAEIGVNSSGQIFVCASTTLVLRAGSYIVFCGW